MLGAVLFVVRAAAYIIYQGIAVPARVCVCVQLTAVNTAHHLQKLSATVYDSRVVDTVKQVVYRTEVGSRSLCIAYKLAARILSSYNA